MVFVATDKINQLYRFDEFSPMIVYGGPLGIGKSAYVIKVAAEAYGSPEKPDYEKVKEILVFKPRDFVTRCYEMINSGDREKILIWDDAGLWLYALDWTNPFVKAVGKYLNVARTNWGCIMFTTPQPTMITKKIRGFPDCVTIKIVKTASNIGHPSKPRRATAYRWWMAPDMKHSGVHKVWVDDYSAMMPDDFYRWYKPIRDKYATAAILQMKKYLSGLDRDARELEDLLDGKRGAA